MTETTSDVVRLQMMKTAGQEMMENFSDFLAKKGKTRLELKVGIAQWFADADRAEALDDEITKEGSVSEVASPELEQLVESYAVEQFVKHKDSMDPLTKLCLGTASDKKRHEPYWLFNEDAWIRGLEGSRTKTGPMFGQFGHIGGKGTGKGKTSFGTRLAEITTRHPTYHVVTNIRMTPPDDVADRVHFVTRLSQLLRWLLVIKMKGGRTVAIGDESLFFFGRQDAMSKEVRDFDKLMKWFRKLYASLVLIAHDFEKDIPEKAKVFFTTRIEKKNLREMRVVITADHYKLNKPVDDVPDADWPFESEGRGGLEMDVDIQHFHDWLNAQEAESSEEEDRLMLTYLDNPELWQKADRAGNAGSGMAQLDEFHAAEEVAANRAQFFTVKGKPDVGAIRKRFRCDEDTAYRIGRLAKTGT